MRGVPVVSLNVDPDSIISRFALGVVEPDFTKLCAQVAALAIASERWQTLSSNCEAYARRELVVNRAVDRFTAIIAAETHDPD
jgi:hypothetical protein